MKNKIMLPVLFAVAGLLYLQTASPANAFVSVNVRNNIREFSQQNISIQFRTTATEQGQTIRKEIREEVKDLRQDIITNIKNKIKALLPHRIHGILKSINGNTLIVTTNKGDITVDVLGTTQLKRRFGGNSSLSEFRVGDELAVIGSKHKVSDTQFSDTEIDARYIRDISIQRRNTVFLGTITTKGTDVMTVQTISRGLQTVHINGSTVFTLRNTTISFADLNVGDRVLVKGEIWDRATSDIDAKRVIKLPLVPTPAAVGNSSSASSSSSSSAASSSSSSSVSSSSSSSSANSVSSI